MRVYLAATSSGMTKELKKKTIQEYKPLYILETFFNGKNKCLEALSISGSDNFLLDSGAFSYMSGAKADLEQMNEYVNRYIAFIKKYKIKYFFELDVDSVFGIQQVEIWRKKIEYETGRQCIPVWHKSRGIEYWKHLCEEYRYIAIGGIVTREIKISEYNLISKLVDYAYKKGVKVHGLGFTRTKELHKYKFYSVDSSSYNTAATHGQRIYFFNGGNIDDRVLKKGNKKVKLGELVAHNLKEWVKYQKYMDMRRF